MSPDHGIAPALSAAAAAAADPSRSHSCLSVVVVVVLVNVQDMRARAEYESLVFLSGGRMCPASSRLFLSLSLSLPFPGLIRKSIDSEGRDSCVLSLSLMSLSPILPL